MPYAPQMYRWFAASLTVLIATELLTACGSPSPPPAVTVTQTSTITVTQAAPAAEPGIAETPAVASEPAMTWTMPNLIGRNLQYAQDEIQRITDNAIFYTSSTDLTGKARNQILDRNWQVCSSTPPPGSTITKDTSIDFGVVRVDTESCP